MLLFSMGEFHQAAITKTRVAKSELLAAMREHGAGSSEEVGAVVLETNGTLSVLQKARFGAGSTLENVQHELPLQG
jgi:uncharacterized membrane protein YcaP (DUF421 family)